MSEGYILKKTEKSLPLNWYFNQKQFDKEISKVLSKEWLYVCHVDTISKPLSFHTVEISKFNILIVRDKDCLLYTSPSPRDPSISRMPSSA